MSATQLLLVAAVVWVGIGLVVSFVMARRGHDLFSWWVLGALFGPLALALAVDSVRQEGRVPPRVLIEGEPAEGDVDLLAGLDGSPESRAALERAVGLLGERVGRLTLAMVVDYDAALDPRDRDVERRAIEELAARAAAVCACRPETVVLAGRPAATLARYAKDEGFDLLVVGTRGRGASKALLGSVASQLAGNREIPVLIAGG